MAQAQVKELISEELLAQQNRAATAAREAEIIPPGENGIGGVVSPCGHFAIYNIYGNEFVLTRRYQPPVRPISRGAYGIVW
jgi:hypothetical protein